MRHRIRNIKRWLARKLAPEYQTPPFLRVYEYTFDTLTTENIASEGTLMAVGEEKLKDLAVDNLCEQLKHYVDYKVRFDERDGHWHIRASVKVMRRE